jgi:hypothetical protein
MSVRNLRAWPKREERSPLLPYNTGRYFAKLPAASETRTSARLLRSKAIMPPLPFVGKSLTGKLDRVCKLGFAGCSAQKLLEARPCK